MKKILCALIICIILTGCSNKENEKVKENKDMIESKEVKKDYIILDVRTNSEYNSGHIEGAINIPYDTIDENTNLDKSKTIYVYCKSGARSNKAYQTLKDLGFDVIDLGTMENAKIELSK